MIYFKVPKDLKKPPIMHYALILIFGLLFVSYVVPVVFKFINQISKIYRGLLFKILCIYIFLRYNPFRLSLMFF